MVLRRCRRLLRDESRAVDAMQDVFVLVLKNHEELDLERPSSLLFRLATNVCLNQLRTVRRHPEDQDDALVLSVAHELDVEAQTHARSLLTRLWAEEPELSATIAVLHHLDGMTWEQVAAEVGRSVSGVRKAARRVTQTLVALSGEDHGS